MSDSIFFVRSSDEAVTPLNVRFANFQEAANSVLKFLHSRNRFALWMLTRTEGEDWIVLSAEDHGYGVKEGDVFRWADSFCAEMVLGRGPRIASDCRREPAYATRPIAQQIPIGAYMGAPLTDSDGNLFGTLCGIDPNPRDESLLEDLPLVELLGGLLNSLLVAELKASADLRRVELRQISDLVDAETGLLSKVTWKRVLEAEEVRCRRFGHPAALASIVISNPAQLGDAALVLSHFVTADETVSRIGDNTSPGWALNMAWSMPKIDYLF
jgi:diguanylate cyclase